MSSLARIFSTMYYRLATVCYRSKGGQKKFIDIFQKRGWAENESVSEGASLEQTFLIRREIPHINEINTHSLLDAPCVDFHWMKGLQLDIDRYI